MTGLSDYTAKNLLNYVTGQVPEPSLPGVWLALMTAVDTDGGTGGTEVTGGSYTRVQVAGAIAAAASWTTATPNITMGSSNPGWVVAGMAVYDETNGQIIGSVSSYSGTALVLQANAAHASSGSTDTLSFSAFGPATGSAPSSVSNTAVITFPQATANWGTVIAFELRDASSSGNLLWWDYLGNFSWLPCTVSAASPGVITAHAHGYSNGDPFVFSVEYGGVAPTFSAGNYTGVLTVAGATTDTFDVAAVNTSASGNGSVRKIIQQSIPQNVTASFQVASLTATAA